MTRIKVFLATVVGYVQRWLAKLELRMTARKVIRELRRLNPGPLVHTVGGKLRNVPLVRGRTQSDLKRAGRTVSDAAILPKSRTGQVTKKIGESGSEGRLGRLRTGVTRSIGAVLSATGGALTRAGERLKGSEAGARTQTDADMIPQAKGAAKEPRPARGANRSTSGPRTEKTRTKNTPEETGSHDATARGAGESGKPVRKRRSPMQAPRPPASGKRSTQHE
ncbi:hypothetical protein A8926_3290 [Saccharopolyspora spinosa]|uniref:Uncharacterized protein n=1 Tax=Saccharopolyspora spinosa TaxID=60894 RepID=A0A2N3XY69_SACSN|nr:hypothetical protein A8926_3290 [Saccharopolyspora spinosa]